MSDEGNPATTPPGDLEGKPSLPGDQPLWWPNMEESRAIIGDYVSQFEEPFPQGTELPEDPDPGDES